MLVTGKLITIAGNSGAGKTTLAQALQRRGSFRPGLESHADRPFQARLAAGLHRFALPNQVDYLLRRAEQEAELRSEAGIALVDGGLEMDFWVFTRHFHLQGWLDNDEYELCRRFYNLVRTLLPPPDLIVVLLAPLPLAKARMAARNRGVEVAREADLVALEALLADWVAGLDPAKTLVLDASEPVDSLADRVCEQAASMGWETTC